MELNQKYLSDDGLHTLFNAGQYNVLTLYCTYRSFGKDRLANHTSWEKAVIVDKLTGMDTGSMGPSGRGKINILMPVSQYPTHTITPEKEVLFPDWVRSWDYRKTCECVSCVDVRAGGWEEFCSSVEE